MKGLHGFIAYSAAPAEIAATIEGAKQRINARHGDGTLTSWRQNDIPGRFIVDPILDELEKADVLVADISVLNFNVVYEIGYAIGLGRRVFIIKNSSLIGDADLAREVGIFDTLGYQTYASETELESHLLSIEDVRPLPLLAPPDRKAPLYLVMPKEKSDDEIRLVSRIKKARLIPRIFDPEEQGRMAAGKAIDGVTASFGVVAPFLPRNRNQANVHNLRSAFVAGLAAGMDRPHLLLQRGDDPIPLDYRDLVKSYQSKERIDSYIAEFVPEVYEATLATTDGPDVRSRTGLALVSLGASAAEEEFQALSHYYLRTEEFERVLRGEVRLVVGRKGSGKTAIFGRLRELLRRNKQKIILDLRPEGFQLLKFKEYVLDRVQQGTKEHVMTAFWEYVLLLEICHKLLEKDKDRHVNDHTLLEPYRKLATLYREDAFVAEGDFAERMARLLDRVQDNFGSLDGSASADALSLSADQITEMVYQHDIRKLRAAVIEYLAFKEELWILFDNLDKGWPPYGLTPADVVAFRALLDATAKLSHTLRNNQIACYATIFVRNDVYEWLLEATSDRGKVSHVLIDWTDPDLLREILRRRIASSIGMESEMFQALWDSICVSHIQGEESSQYLIDRSLMRPRGLIDLVQFCRSRALNLGKQKIDESDVREGEERYSTELVTNIGYEIRDVLPVAADVLYGFLGGPVRLGINDIWAAFRSARIPDEHRDRVLHMLLWYGVIGIVREDDEPAYIYSVKYDLKRLVALGRKSPGGSPLYCVNPAFWSGLEIQILQTA